MDITVDAIFKAGILSASSIFKDERYAHELFFKSCII